MIFFSLDKILYPLQTTETVFTWWQDNSNTNSRRKNILSYMCTINYILNRNYSISIFEKTTIYKVEFWRGNLRIVRVLFLIKTVLSETFDMLSIL